MPFEEFLGGWNASELRLPAEVLGTTADRLISIKLRPVAYTYRYEAFGRPPFLLTSHMPDQLYEEWDDQLRVTSPDRQSVARIPGCRRATKFDLQDGTQALLLEHESGPEIILWLMQNPEVAAAALVAGAAAVGTVKSLIDLAVAPFGLGKSALDALRAYLELQKVLVARLEKANARTASGDRSDDGYHADAVTLELRSSDETRLLSMMPLPVIDATMLDRFHEEAMHNLVTGTAWSGTPPSPEARPTSSN